MLDAGMNQRAIQEKLGLEGENVIQKLLTRERRKVRIGKSKIKLCKGKNDETTEEIIKRLKMENEILRDFKEEIERRRAHR